MDVMTFEAAVAATARRRALCDAVKRLIVDRLDLVLEPEWITDDQPLFGRGLELDSVDALEIAVGLEYQFDVMITDDDVGALGSVNTVVDYVEAQGYGEELLRMAAGEAEA